MPAEIVVVCAKWAPDCPEPIPVIPPGAVVSHSCCEHCKESWLILAGLRPKKESIHARP